MVQHSAPVDGFRLAYEQHGDGYGDGHGDRHGDQHGDRADVVLLHGWPGDRTDYRAVVPMLRDHAHLVVPDLRGFGESDKHDQPPADAYSASAQARSVLGLIDELGLERVVLVGYDVGSRVAQTIARRAPDRVAALVLTPPLPGAGERVFGRDAQAEFWYQHFHRLPVSEALIDGDPGAVRAYLHQIWSHWSGPGHDHVADLDHLVEVYSAPGAFTASIGWYRAGGSVATARPETPPDDPSTIPLRAVWPHHDPLFPLAWSDRLGEWYADVVLTEAPDSGHFVPLEAPDVLAAQVRTVLPT